MKNLKGKGLLTILLVLALFVSSASMVFADLQSFLVQAEDGRYYEYNSGELDNSYLAYQINPASPAADMYEQFLAIGGSTRVVALGDSVKGWMDFAAAQNASLAAQIAEVPFVINDFFATPAAPVYAGTVTDPIVVKPDGTTADLEAYNAALADVATKVEADYTADSWANLQTVLAANVMTSANTQVEINTAVGAINGAIEALVEVPTVDLAAYDAAVAAAAALTEADYTADSWTNLQTVLAANVMTSANTQVEIDAAVGAINAAIDALVEVADMAAYDAAVAQAEAVVEADYTAATYAALQTALTDNVVTNQDSQADVDAATAAITAAYEALAPLLKLASVDTIAVTKATVTLAAVPTKAPVAGDFFISIDGGAEANPTAIAAKTGDTTGKVFELTYATLANTQGVMKINRVAKANITGTDVNFDFKVPAVESVTALNKNTVQVVFGEKLNKVESEKVASYKISKVVPGTFVAANPTSAVLQADGKTVNLIFASAQEMIDSANGYSLTVNADATATNNTVQDLAGNKAVATERIFSGSGATDQTAPTIVNATYDKTTGLLTLNFSKPVLRTTVGFDQTKMTIQGTSSSYTLLKADYTAAGGTTASSAVVVPLTAASKTAVAALGDTLVLDVAAGAVSDTNITPVKNEAISDYPIASTIAPTLQTAAYDQSSRILTLTFAQSDIDVSTFDVKGITLAGSTLTSKSTLNTTTNGKVIDIQVEPTVTVNAASTISLTAATAKNTAGTAVVAVTNKAITYKADTTKPTLQTASYNNATKEITLSFSELIDVSATTIGSITITDGTTTVTLSATTAVVGTTDASTVRIALKAADNTAVNGMDASKLKIVLAANAFKDLAGNGIAEIKATANFPVTKVDQVAPTATISAGNSSTTAVVAFDKKVNKAQAETAANYQIKSGLVTLNVTSAVLRADGITVDLTTSDQSAITYALTINNVSDLVGNAYVNPTTLPTFTGTAGQLDTVRPIVSSATYVDNGDGQPSAGDVLAVVFDKALATPIADVKAADFTFGAGLTVANPTFAYGATNEVMNITIGSGSTATWATPGVVTVAASGTTGLKDASGNIANTTSATIASPSGGVPNISVVTYTDTNNDFAKSAGDTVEVQFNQPITLDSIPTVADVIEAGKLSLVGNAAGTAAISIKSGTTDTIVFTTTEAPTMTFDATNDNIVGLATGGPSNTWGEALAALGTGIKVTKADAANGQLVTATYNKTTSVLTLNYDKLLKVQNTSKDIKADIVLLSGGVSTTWAGTVTTGAIATTDLKVDLAIANATDQAVLESGVATIQIKAGGSAELSNAYDALLIPAATPVAVTVVE